MDPNQRKAVRRLRRRRHIRRSLFGTPERPRLTVSRSLRHLRCQVVDDTRGVTLVTASTLTPELRDEIGENGGNRKGAEIVGRLLAQRAKEKGIRALAFDRNGYRYHGRVAMLAETLRKEGIEV